jgi:hypothetical protein
MTGPRWTWNPRLGLADFNGTIVPVTSTIFRRTGSATEVISLAGNQSGPTVLIDTKDLDDWWTS